MELDLHVSFEKVVIDDSKCNSYFKNKIKFNILMHNIFIIFEIRLQVTTLKKLGKSPGVVVASAAHDPRSARGDPGAFVVFCRPNAGG